MLAFSYSLMISTCIMGFIFSIGCSSGFLCSIVMTRTVHTWQSTTESSWDIADDWNTLSQNEAGARLFENVDSIMIEEHILPKISDAIDDAIESIHFPIVEIGNHALYDLEEESYQSKVDIDINMEESIASEIALLVRCNEDPQQLLYQEGRAIPPLSDDDRYDVSQLVHSYDPQLSMWKPTQFLIDVASKIFRMYCTEDNLLTANGMAQWMSVGMGQAIGQHDMRVYKLISKYSSYGTGVLTEAQLLQVYIDAIKSVMDEELGTTNGNRNKKVLAKRVWQELENHGIDSPNFSKYKDIQKAYNRSHDSSFQQADTILDECEIMSWSDDLARTHELSSGDVTNTPGKSSHMSVEFCSDKYTPKRIRDGQFVFVDEESCIGCGHCANIAMTTFVMLGNGRARSFYQANTPEVSQAVAACPVNCIKNVSFDELKQLEISRDNGDGRHDHKHLGKEMTPLHVSRRSSDASHKSSWYHHLKSKCSSEKMCPQRGCFDCPMYSYPGLNPFFQKKHREAERIRAQDIIDSGQGQCWRKYVDL